jgi:hypothetical protein
MCVRTNVHFCMKIMLAYSPKTNFVFVSHGSKNIQLFSVLAVVYANDGWTKLQFAYFDYFPVYYFFKFTEFACQCYLKLIH